MDLKRYGEAQTSIEQVLLCEDLKELRLEFPVNKEKKQSVPFKAAILNLKGLISYQLKDASAAKKAFEEALAILPDFAYAQQNKAAIDVEIKK
jgi:tetratricopeptide (TPR) repeat protein